MDEKKTNKKKSGFWREFLCALPFFVAVCLVVLSLPRQTTTFKYQFELGKPWQYDLLTATYDFPIYKSQEEIKAERDEILNRHVPIFDLDDSVKDRILQKIAGTEEEQSVLVNEDTKHVNIQPYRNYLSEELAKINSLAIGSIRKIDFEIQNAREFCSLSPRELRCGRYLFDISGIFLTEWTDRNPHDYLFLRETCHDSAK